MTAEEAKDGRPGGLPMNEAVPSSPTVGIPDALLAAIGAANSHGETLRCGDYVAIWDEGEFPYGKPDKCPFCKEPQNYTELWYNGPGSPPSYAVMCGHCGAQGPTSSGKGRGDHYGARIDAVRLWNTAQGIEAGTVETERLDAQHENPVACDAPTACSEEAAMISEQMKAEGAGNVVRFAKKCRFCEDRHQVWQLCGLLPEVGAPHRLAYKPKGHHP